MSHFSTIKTQIADKQTLMSTLQELGFTVKVQGIVRGHNGLTVEADIVARLPGQYDLGWSAGEDGKFDLVADLWGVAKEHNQQKLLAAINQKYAINRTLKEIDRLGLKLSDTSFKGDGSVRLIASRQ